MLFLGFSKPNKRLLWDLARESVDFSRLLGRAWFAAVKPMGNYSEKCKILKIFLNMCFQITNDWIKKNIYSANTVLPPNLTSFLMPGEVQLVHIVIKWPFNYFMDQNHFTIFGSSHKHRGTTLATCIRTSTLVYPYFVKKQSKLFNSTILLSQCCNIIFINAHLGFFSMEWSAKEYCILKWSN